MHDPDNNTIPAAIGKKCRHMYRSSEVAIILFKFYTANKPGTYSSVYGSVLPAIIQIWTFGCFGCGLITKMTANSQTGILHAITKRSLKEFYFFCRTVSLNLIKQTEKCKRKALDAPTSRKLWLDVTKHHHTWLLKEDASFRTSLPADIPPRGPILGQGLKHDWMVYDALLWLIVPRSPWWCLEASLLDTIPTLASSDSKKLISFQ